MLALLEQKIKKLLNLIILPKYFMNDIQDFQRVMIDLLIKFPIQKIRFVDELIERILLFLFMAKG